jgi:hypothetical protein
MKIALKRKSFFTPKRNRRGILFPATAVAGSSHQRSGQSARFCRFPDFDADEEKFRG